MTKPTSDGTGGDLAHIWLLRAEEQVDEQPADMVAAAGASDARQSNKRRGEANIGYVSFITCRVAYHYI